MKRLRRVRPWKWNVRNPGRQRYGKWRVCKQTWHVHMPSTSIFVKFFVLDRRKYIYIYNIRIHICIYNIEARCAEKIKLQLQTVEHEIKEITWGVQRAEKLEQMRSEDPTKNRLEICATYNMLSLCCAVQKRYQCGSCVCFSSLSCPAAGGPWWMSKSTFAFENYLMLQAGNLGRVRKLGLKLDAIYSTHPSPSAIRWSPDHQKEES